MQPAGLHASGGTPPEELARVTIAAAFGAVVEQHGERLALHDPSGSISYTELDLASNAVAHSLAAEGRTKPVCVVAPLGIGAATVLLGALKAGRLFVAIDPRQPPEQWLKIAADTEGLLVVPDDAARAHVAPELGAKAVITYDGLASSNTSPLDVVVDPDEPAFVFFTSGSTGTPKGTILSQIPPQHGLALADVSLDDRLALVAPLAHIGGTIMLVAILLTGASGWCFDLGGGDVSGIVDFVRDSRITLLCGVVSIVRAIAQLAADRDLTLPTVRIVIAGGETGTVQNLEQARATFLHARFLHPYGSTETGNVSVSDLDVVTPGADGSLPLGWPWPWFRVDILDEDGVAVPPSEPGEIVVTGRDVALGYWNDPDGTAARFVENGDGSRSVRTHDLGRVRPDGMLEHLGRLDARVKVHGQLVDLRAVEHELLALPYLVDAVASAALRPEGDHRVVAHVVTQADAQVTVASVRRDLGRRLPPYMIPTQFFGIDSIPKAKTGKVDRAWLSECAAAALPREPAHVEPSTDDQRWVAGAFREILAVDHVGIHDDFFELGGDSLSVLELLAAIHDEFAVELTPSELLADASVERLAELLHVHADGGDRSLMYPLRAVGTGPPFFFVPGAGSTPFELRSLARRLTHCLPYSFLPRGFQRVALPDRTVAALARRYVVEVRSLDPCGPYFLGGYSFGGVVALEMAAQLRDTGADVALLALVEPPVRTPASDRMQRVRRFDATTRAQLSEEQPGRDVAAVATRTTRYVKKVVSYTALHAYTSSAGLLRRGWVHQSRVFLGFQGRMLRHYHPRPYVGPTLLVGSPTYFQEHTEALTSFLPTRELGGGRIDAIVDAPHLRLMLEPAVHEVALQVDGALLAVQVEGARAASG